MELLELRQDRRLRREDAAARLHMLADALGGHDELEFQRDGARFRVIVPSEVQLRVELEIEDHTELEIQLTW